MASMANYEEILKAFSSYDMILYSKEGLNIYFKNLKKKIGFFKGCLFNSNASLLVALMAWEVVESQKDEKKKRVRKVEKELAMAKKRITKL